MDEVDWSGYPLGKGGATNLDDFLENFLGGGSFSIQKFILQIFGPLNRAF